MVLDFIFDGFLCISMVCIMQNHKNLVLSPFWEILSKNGPIFAEKWVPETLNRDIWYFTFLNRSQEPNDLET